jgi:hypothetical protein
VPPKDILHHLLEVASSRKKGISRDVFTLRGLWLTHYILHLDEKSTILNLHYVQAQTLGHGCSYFEPSEEEPGLSESLLGKNVLELRTEYRSIQIAGLDAAFSSLNGTPSDSVVLDGTNIRKNAARAELVCREVLRLLKGRTPKGAKKYKIVNVGVIGNFLYMLSQRKNIILSASDFYKGVVGKSIYGVRVEHGTKTPDLIAEADVGIVTGMTLANKSMEEIIESAQENGTALVMFAETGANFASEYCKMGVDVVVSEPFPFYLSSNGRTKINIYRSH